MNFIPVMQVYPRCFVPPRCLEYTVRLTGRCVPVPLSGMVFKGAGTVITFGPTVLPVRNPKCWRDWDLQEIVEGSEGLRRDVMIGPS